MFGLGIPNILLLLFVIVCFILIRLFVEAWTKRRAQRGSDSTNEVPNNIGVNASFNTDGLSPSGGDTVGIKDDAVRKKLFDIMAEYGVALLNEPRRIESMLRDLGDEHSMEINMLINALRLKIPMELHSAAMVDTTLIVRLTRHMEDKLGVKEELARWAVESWTLALGKVQV